MSKKKPQENSSHLNLVDKDLYNSGGCLTIWINKVQKGELTWDEVHELRKQKSLQETSTKK